MIRIRIYLSDSICLLGITFFLSSNVEQATTFGSTIRATHIDQCSITSLALLSRMPSPFSDSGMAVGRTRDEPAQGIRVAYVCSSTYCNASMNSSTVTSPFATSTPSSVIIQSGSRHDRKVGHPAYRECGDEDRDVRRHTCQSRPTDSDRNRMRRFSYGKVVFATKERGLQTRYETSGENMVLLQYGVKKEGGINCENPKGTITHIPMERICIRL